MTLSLIILYFVTFKQQTKIPFLFLFFMNNVIGIGISRGLVFPLLSYHCTALAVANSKGGQRYDTHYTTLLVQLKEAWPHPTLQLHFHNSNNNKNKNSWKWVLYCSLVNDLDWKLKVKNIIIFTILSATLCFVPFFSYNIINLNMELYTL